MTGIQVKFNVGLEPATAANPSYYQLALVKKGRTRKSPVQYVTVSMASPSYNPATDTVTLVPLQKLKSGTYQLLVLSSLSGGVLDGAGQPLDRDSATIVLAG